MKIESLEMKIEQLKITTNHGFLSQRMDGADFLLEEKIGEGIYGEVFLSRKKVDGSVVALKRMTKNNVIGHSDIRNSFYQELRAGSVLTSHEGVVTARGYFESSNHFWLVFEYIEGKSLFQFLRERNFVPLGELQVRQIFVQLVEAISHAHHSGVAHLDLKLENILLTDGNKTKIIDWGLCSFDVKKCTQLCGSPEYAPPEMWTRTEFTYNASKADVFSLGIVLFALLFGTFPYSSYNMKKMRDGYSVQPPILDNTVSQSAKNLVLSMIDQSPDLRISIQEILNHDWLIKEIVPSSRSSS